MSITPIDFATPQDYLSIYQQMQQFTQQRTAQHSDQIWFLEHQPVFTQGQAGKAEHLLDPGTIPVIHCDRGGQITYHGPGQLMVYLLLDLKKRDFGIRGCIDLLEQSVIELLQRYAIVSMTRPHAPGVYTQCGAKICSLGLRVRKGCTYHGISLNVAMDLSPFARINPCGDKTIRMIDMQALVPTITLSQVKKELKLILLTQLKTSHLVALRC
jgi:lipoyl(octanoyl) transferase